MLSLQRRGVVLCWCSLSLVKRLRFQGERYGITTKATAGYEKNR
jgi:hypothetical protein